MVHESSVEVLGDFPCFPPELLRVERSEGRVSVGEVLEGGGPVHRRFIEALPEAWRADPALEIFSRGLFLKQGWLPLTPHYHLDWGRGADGAPVETIMVLLGGASQTEFVLGPLDHPELEEPRPRGERPRGGERTRWDAQVEAGLAAGTLRTWRLRPQTLVRFDNRTLHRARPASYTGFRLLIRAIRGLRHPERPLERLGGYGNPGRFTTCRNGFIPLTPDERTRFAPYRD